MTITYELAKKLKEAGFPQKRIEYNCQYCESAFGPKKQDEYCMPTIEELIEACLDFYFPCSFEMGGKNTWWAILRDEKNVKALVPVQSGSTLLEAVANLYIALNTKQHG